MIAGVVGPRQLTTMRSGTALERPATEGESPVRASMVVGSGILSRAGPEKPCLNRPAPSGKAKYSSVTDSEQVP